jgi:hypothetical protein
MSRFFLFLLLVLNVLLTVGCDTRPVDDDTGADDDATGDDDDAEAFEATFHIVAPYDWVGDFAVNGETVCEDEPECYADVEETGEYVLEIEGWNFMCVPQDKLLGEAHNGQIIEMITPWTGEAQCGLAPEGTYVGDNSYLVIETQEIDKQIFIVFLSMGCEFPVTDDSFEGACGQLNYDVGIISDDLEEIYYHRINQDGSETENTLFLQ